VCSSDLPKNYQRVYGNPKVNHRLHNGPSLVLILSQINPVHTTPFYSSKIIYHIIPFYSTRHQTENNKLRGFSPQANYTDRAGNRLLGSCAVYFWVEPTFRRNVSPLSSWQVNRKIPIDGFLHSHRRENLKSYILTAIKI
jgi:hypothetical protein